MKKPDEIEIIKIFQKKFVGKTKSQYNDDLEVLDVPKSKIYVKSDMLVQSTDVPNFMKPAEISRKSLVSCVSDFACKGVRPRFATIAIAIPEGFTKKMIDSLATGFQKASKEYGVKIIGGDTNQGKEIVIEVSMFGTNQGKIPSRGGAKKGDIIVTTGPFGYTSSALKIAYEKHRTGAKFAKKSMGFVKNPKPRLEFGLQAAKYFTSSMDSSDGLAICLHEMSSQSKKKFVIFGIPTNPDVVEFAAKNKIDVKDLVFCGGEEYEIVFTVSPKDLHKIRQIGEKLGVPLFYIGFVTSGRNVTFNENNRERILERCGWVHLESSKL